MADDTTFEGWAIVELMGHRRLAGYVHEVELAGAGMLRLDIPEEGDLPAATQFYAPGAVYAITPTTEATARLVRSRPSPVSLWEIPRPALERPDDDGPDLHDDAEWDELESEVAG